MNPVFHTRLLVTPNKTSGTPVARIPLAPIESNTQQPKVLITQQLITPSKSSSYTQSQQQSNNHSLQPSNNQLQVKPSPGQLRSFFPLLSPEEKRILKENAAAAAAAHQMDDGRPLECDETLAPIPMFLDMDSSNSHDQPMNEDAFQSLMSTNQQLQQSLHSSTSHQSNSQLDTPHVKRSEKQPPPTKSPMSTLLSAVKPTNQDAVNSAITRVARGLSITFGDLHSPITVTPYQPPPPAQTNNNVSQMVAALSNSRTESVNSQDTMDDQPAAPAPTTTKHRQSGSGRVSTGGEQTRFNCGECTKTFPSNSALSMHLLIHSGEKPFVCPQTDCSKCFRQKGHLVSHFRKHTGQKPFACPGENCTKRFKDKSGLNAHVKRSHPGTSTEHVSASTPSDDQDAAMDPADESLLQAAINQANRTLAALQAATLVVASANNHGSTPPLKKNKRKHESLTDGRSSTTPALTEASGSTPVPTHTTGGDSPAAAFVHTSDAMEQDEDKTEREIEHLTGASQLSPSNATSSSNQTTLDEPITQALKKSRSDSLSPATIVPRLLPGHIGHSMPSMQQAHDRTSGAATSNSSGSFSPMTHSAPSPVNFSAHLSGTRSGQSTPTNGMSASSWMPQIPSVFTGAPSSTSATSTNTAALFTNTHTSNANLNHTTFHYGSLPPIQTNTSTPTASSLSTTTTNPPSSSAASSQSFNPSSTSAFSFKINPTPIMNH